MKSKKQTKVEKICYVAAMIIVITLLILGVVQVVELLLGRCVI